jgi:hypothetical protein
MAKRIDVAGLAALVAIALSGCNATENARERRVATKAVVAGGKVELNGYRSLELDCSANPAPRINIIQKPAFGTVSTERNTAFPAFPADNPRSRCNTRRVPNLSVVYRANANAGAKDRVVFEVIWHDGELWKADYTILVR